MLENLMILTRTLYDPQEQPLTGTRCSECGEVIQGEYTEFSNGDMICEDCLTEYARAKAPEFAEEFVKEHELEYLAEWWLPSLSDLAQKEIYGRISAFALAILRSEYKKLARYQPWEAQEKLDYIAEHMDDFIEFLTKEG